MMKLRLTLPIFMLLSLILSACALTLGKDTMRTPLPATDTQPLSTLPTASTITNEGEIESISKGEMRYLDIQTDLASAAQIDIPLPGKPVWVAGVPYGDGSAWAVALEDGQLAAYIANSSGYTQIAISSEVLSAGMPLTIYSKGGELFALTAPDADASPLTVPILIDPDLPKIAYIAANGDLVIWQDNVETRLPVNALPDSRILTDENSRLLFLSDPTDRYTHGVLGDNIEAAGVTLVETNPEPRVLRTIFIPEPDVIEGIYPVWADLSNDGQREIIVTLSNAQAGARIIAFHENGSIQAEGPPIGVGFRWRHQLMVAPFGADGEHLLAVVRTPHIGGVVEFYRLRGNKLEIVTEIPGISTHAIGSRNLFTAQAGDFDDDGRVELLASDQSHRFLGIVGMDGESITWLNLEAELVTNLAVVNVPDSEDISLAAGLSNNVLRIWLP